MTGFSGDYEVEFRLLCISVFLWRKLTVTMFFSDKLLKFKSLEKKEDNNKTSKSKKMDTKLSLAY